MASEKIAQDGELAQRKVYQFSGDWQVHNRTIYNVFT
jgi:hypothetical protein